MARRTLHPISEVVIYTRISRDADGEEAGVQRQEQACRERAAREAWTVTHVFTDNDISASGRSTKRRSQFETMMAAAEAGEIRAILAYSNSRLTRRPMELERLVSAHRATGVEFRTVVSGDDDLSTADGLMVARIKGSVDAAESDKIAERVSAAVRQRAEAGRIHGRCAFGYETVIGPDLKVQSWRHHPQHTAWMREAAGRVLAGESLYGICADWNAQGRLTGNQRGWRSQTLKRALTSPAIAGYRALDDKLVSATMWTAILEEDYWQRLRALLGTGLHQARAFSTGQTAARYALSGLVICGRCGCSMSAIPGERQTGAAFVCLKTNHPGGVGRPIACGSMRILMSPLEQWVFAQLLDYLDTRPLATLLSDTTPDDERTEQQEDLRAAIEADRRRLQRLDDERTDADPDSGWDDVRWRRQVRRLTERIAANRQQLGKIERDAAQSAVRVNLDAPSVESGWTAHASGSRADNAWRRSAVGTFIESISIAAFPEGQARTLTRRRDETDADLALRRATHQIAVLQQRVLLNWRQ